MVKDIVNTLYVYVKWMRWKQIYKTEIPYKEKCNL